MIDNYSEYIEIVAEFLEERGCKVTFFDSGLPEGICGRIYYKMNMISLNCDSARDAMYTILHEAGHWMWYNRLRDKTRIQVTGKREILAYLYGWYIITLLKLPISKSEWKTENLRIREVVEQYSHQLS